MEQLRKQLLTTVQNNKKTGKRTRATNEETSKK